MSDKKVAIIQKDELPSKPTPNLIQNVIDLIESAKTHVANYTNSTLVMLYWHIGSLINKDMLENKRADYGEQTLLHVSKELTTLYGSGFDRANISRMIKFSKLIP